MMNMLLSLMVVKMAQGPDFSSLLLKLCGIKARRSWVTMLDNMMMMMLVAFSHDDPETSPRAHGLMRARSSVVDRRRRGINPCRVELMPNLLESEVACSKEPGRVLLFLARLMPREEQGLRMIGGRRRSSATLETGRRIVAHHLLLLQLLVLQDLLLLPERLVRFLGRHW